MCVIVKPHGSARSSAEPQQSGNLTQHAHDTGHREPFPEVVAALALVGGAAIGGHPPRRQPAGQVLGRNRSRSLSSGGIVSAAAKTVRPSRSTR